MHPNAHAIHLVPRCFYKLSTKAKNEYRENRRPSLPAFICSWPQISPKGQIVMFLPNTCLAMLTHTPLHGTNDSNEDLNMANQEAGSLETFCAKTRGTNTNDRLRMPNAMDRVSQILRTEWRGVYQACEAVGTMRWLNTGPSSSVCMG